MKINYLKISRYKNLNGEIKFNSNLITLLIGQNGTGKSNLLEVFATIFSYLYGYALNYFSKIDNPPFDFVIEYECLGNTIQAGMKNGYITLYKKDDKQHILLPILKRGVTDNYKKYLPSQIFVYYSGENRRIDDIFSSYVTKEFSKRKDTYKRGEALNEPMHIITFNNTHSSFILLTLLIYRELRDYREAINVLLNNILRIDVDSKIGFRIESPDFVDLKKLRKGDKLLGNYIDSSTGFTETIRESSVFWGLKGIINDFLEELIQYVEYTSSPYKHGTYKRGRKEKEFLDFSQINLTDDFCKRIFQYFTTPIDFFNMLVEMNSLGMIKNEDFNFSIAKTDNIGSRFSFRHLSEGEQQYLTIMGMIALNKNSRNEMLYLLDEPDTHINPIWQREYISTIIKTIGDEDKEKLSFFISTHSPFLVQSYDEKETSMILFYEDEHGNVEINQGNETIKNWTIDQVLLSKYFNFKSTRPSSFDEFVDKRNKIVEKGEVNEKDIKYLQNVNRDMGFLPTGESLNDIKVMASIHRMYQELKKN